MSNIKKEIESLRAKIARLEEEQKKAEQQRKALVQARQQIDSVLKENGVSFEAYILSQQAQVSRVLQKLGDDTAKPDVKTKKRAGKKKAVAKPRRSKKTAIVVKIPAGRYGNLPNDPDKVFDVKEKGPRPKQLKAYAEEIGLEAFLKNCRISG